MKKVLVILLLSNDRLKTIKSQVCLMQCVFSNSNWTELVNSTKFNTTLRNLLTSFLCLKLLCDFLEHLIFNFLLLLCFHLQSSRYKSLQDEGNPLLTDETCSVVSKLHFSAFPLLSKPAANCIRSYIG